MRGIWFVGCWSSKLAGICIRKEDKKERKKKEMGEAE